MKRLLPFLLVLAACGADVPPDRGGGCADCGRDACPTPEPPVDCPIDRIRETFDLDSGCPLLVCGPCPDVPIPICEEGRPLATRDETGCPIAWACAPCEPPPPPSCPGGHAVPEADAHGCVIAWRCEACPPVDPPQCADAAPRHDPATGCVVGWQCPECPEVPAPGCEGAAGIPGEDGCVVGWRCPDDRWSDVAHLFDAELIEALADRIDDHRVHSYDEIRDEMFGWVDVVDGWIECIYTGRRTRPDGTRTPGGFNTEHSWPRSDGADVAPRNSDLHHLFPTDEEANARRGNLPYGDTDCAGGCDWAVGGSEVGRSVAGDHAVFEVRPAFRGDVARAHFYFSVRYRLPIPRSEEIALRRWHEEDPPSDRERERNDRIESLQHNRNPFVDRPDFVARIADF